MVAAREVLVAELDAAGIASHPSQSNFVLVELGADDLAVCAELMRRGILVRGGTEFGLPGLVRVTVAPEPRHAARGRRDRERRPSCRGDA